MAALGWNLLSFLLGGGLLTGIFKFVVDRKLKAADEKKAKERAATIAEAEKRAEANRREYLLVEEYRHALGRYTFWMMKHLHAIERKMDYQPYNGEQNDARTAFEAAEKEMKRFKNERVADLHTD